MYCFITHLSFHTPATNVNYSDAENGTFQDNKVNGIAADALVT